jgi:hypothetical protein
MISIHILFHIFGAWKILFESVKVWRFLNPFELVNIVEYIQTTPPGTMLNGPICWPPAAALPRSPLFLQHPVADHWAMMSPGPTCQSCPAALPCSPGPTCQLHRTTSPAPHRPEPSRHHGPATTPAPPSFSPSPSIAWHAPANTPLPLPHPASASKGISCCARALPSPPPLLFLSFSLCRMARPG